MGDPGTLHFESLERPVAGGDGTDKAVSDWLTHCEGCLVRIEFGRTRWFLEDLINRQFQVRVPVLEEVFEEQRKELAGTVEASCWNC